MIWYHLKNPADIFTVFSGWQVLYWTCYVVWDKANRSRSGLDKKIILANYLDSFCVLRTMIFWTHKDLFLQTVFFKWFVLKGSWIVNYLTGYIEIVVVKILLLILDGNTSHQIFLINYKCICIIIYVFIICSTIHSTYFKLLASCLIHWLCSVVDIFIF